MPYVVPPPLIKSLWICKRKSRLNYAKNNNGNNPVFGLLIVGKKVESSEALYDFTTLFISKVP
mgnify:CR=1